MRIKIYYLVVCASLLANVAEGAPPVERKEQEWSVKRVYDPIAGMTRCVMETRPRAVHDGYRNSVVFLRVDRERMLVVAQSQMDISKGDVGVSVDQMELIKPDSVYLDESLLYDKSIGEIINQFKPGLEAQVYLRFWPTWPSKGLKTVSFSLLGFTRQYARLPDC